MPKGIYKRKYDFISKKFLIKEYINKRKSSNLIAKEIGCNYGCILLKLKKFNIKMRTKSENSIGKNNGFFGKKHTIKSLKKMSKVHKGQKVTVKSRKKMSISHKKRFKKCKQWNKGKKMGNVKHHIYGKKYNDILILTNSNHAKLHQWAYFYILKKYGKIGIDKYIKWFKRKIK